MTLWLRDLQDKFDALSLRERVLIMSALLGLLAVLWDSLLIKPLHRQRRQQTQQINDLRLEIVGLEQAMAEMAERGSVDPDRQTREAIEALNQDLAVVDDQMESMTAGLINPREMAGVLEQLLARKIGLQIVSLRSLPAEGLLPRVAAPGAEGAPAARIFKHGLELELTGGYLDTLRFLQALEKLRWRFFWDRIELSVEQHPVARIKLMLYTLSLQEGWIGV